ncbi:hypothetical protein DXV65_01165 [Pseudomonas fluorescens]|nr:hypothetical protein DXV65_01165 [Pseudomonas fluorescens]
MGAGLPAKAVAQPTPSSTDPPPSRASPAPTVIWIVPKKFAPLKINCGSWLACESDRPANTFID